MQFISQLCICDIVNNNRSSPPLEIYRSEKLLSQMREVAGEYLISTVRANEDGVLYAPELVFWYAEDYIESKPGEMDWITGLASHFRGLKPQQHLLNFK